MLFGNHQYHPCDISHFSHQQPIAPYIFYPITLLVVTVLFPVVIIGLLILVDRSRLTPVVRARSVQPNYELEQFITSGIRHYGGLNLI